MKKTTLLAFLFSAALSGEALAREGMSIMDRWLSSPLDSIAILIFVAGFGYGIYRKRPVYAFAALSLSLTLVIGPGVVMRAVEMLS